ncbi:phosphotransferase [Desertihabitans aurantiacus]|uniref:phosphotransferase n=1 Tax=Desertihabitans aurantiacus TaxID=2282477 RepID=UPI0018E5262E|nr:phosphotransferase [Desertihabitans aurantiacus]
MAPGMPDESAAHRPEPAGGPPAAVLELAGGRPHRLVWHNGLGGLTYSVGEPVVEYVKWSPEHWEVDLGLEADKLVWTRRWLPTPEVLHVGAGIDARHGPSSWLHTRALPGSSAIDPGWQSEDAVVELGRALRRLHDALPVRECPWSWSAENRLSELATHLPQNDVSGVLDPPEVDVEVVCHGDACNPNFLLGPGADGRPVCTGYLDLGQLGVGDRWADLAPAVLSLGWNFDRVVSPRRARDLLLEGCQVDLDADRLDYYTRLWQAGDATD